MMSTPSHLFTQLPKPTPTATPAAAATSAFKPRSSVFKQPKTVLLSKTPKATPAAPSAAGVPASPSAPGTVFLPTVAAAQPHPDPDPAPAHARDTEDDDEHHRNPFDSDVESTHTAMEGAPEADAETPPEKEDDFEVRSIRHVRRLPDPLRRGNVMLRAARPAEDASAGEEDHQQEEEEEEEEEDEDPTVARLVSASHVEEHAPADAAADPVDPAPAAAAAAAAAAADVAGAPVGMSPLQVLHALNLPVDIGASALSLFHRLLQGRTGRLQHRMRAVITLILKQTDDYKKNSALYASLPIYNEVAHTCEHMARIMYERRDTFRKLTLADRIALYDVYFPEMATTAMLFGTGRHGGSLEDRNFPTKSVTIKAVCIGVLRLFWVLTSIFDILVTDPAFHAQVQYAETMAMVQSVFATDDHYMDDSLAAFTVDRQTLLMHTLGEAALADMKTSRMPGDVDLHSLDGRLTFFNDCIGAPKDDFQLLGTLLHHTTCFAHLFHQCGISPTDKAWNVPYLSVLGGYFLTGGVQSFPRVAMMERYSVAVLCALAPDNDDIDTIKARVSSVFKSEREYIHAVAVHHAEVCSNPFVVELFQPEHQFYQPCHIRRFFSRAFRVKLRAQAGVEVVDSADDDDDDDDDDDGAAAAAVEDDDDEEEDADEDEEESAGHEDGTVGTLDAVAEEDEAQEERGNGGGKSSSSSSAAAPQRNSKSQRGATVRVAAPASTTDTLAARVRAPPKRFGAAGGGTGSTKRSRAEASSYYESAAEDDVGRWRGGGRSAAPPKKRSRGGPVSALHDPSLLSDVAQLFHRVFGPQTCNEIYNDLMTRFNRRLAHIESMDDKFQMSGVAFALFKCVETEDEHMSTA